MTKSDSTNDLDRGVSPTGGSPAGRGSDEGSSKHASSSQQAASSASSATRQSPTSDEETQAAPEKTRSGKLGSKPQNRRPAKQQEASGGKATTQQAAGSQANRAAGGQQESASKPTSPKKSRRPLAVGVPAQPIADDEEDRPSYKFWVFNALPSWFISMIVHAAIIIILAVFTLPITDRSTLSVTSTEPDEVEEIEDFELEEITLDEQPVLENFETLDSNDAPQQLEEMAEEPEISDSIENPFNSIDVSSFSEMTAPVDSIAQQMGSSLTNDLASRSSNERARMVREGGGSEASEQAVMMALAWLAAHQREDGGWDFDHTKGPGDHRTSPNPGMASVARNGATGLALLPFLGAGQTHLEGQYKDVVANGLRFLIRNQRPSAGAGSFHEPAGNMYSHGLCSIALTEAYAMTNDRDLLGPAQAAINFIVYAQDPVGGGWRYSPQEAGDTSVVGWQLMALKSAYMGYLQVPPKTIRNAEKFLDSVSLDSGSYYGYTGPGKGSATTAIGLLSRMYMGWDRDHPSLVRGVDFLSEIGPSKTGRVDMYYNYYATQVMRHYGGKPWEDWNAEMRDWLIDQQATRGNMKGSWFFDHPWADRGGRLYNTAMSCMVLEVYYRHLPIYREKAAAEEFPLD